MDVRVSLVHSKVAILVVGTMFVVGAATMASACPCPLEDCIPPHEAYGEYIFPTFHTECNDGSHPKETKAQTWEILDKCVSPQCTVVDFGLEVTTVVEVSIPVAHYVEVVGAGGWVSIEATKKLVKDGKTGYTNWGDPEDGGFEGIRTAHLCFA